MANNIGFVYVLDNETFDSSLLKIGYTKGNPYERAQQLSSATGVPCRFRVLAFAGVSNPRLAERLIHSWMSEYRIDGKEFFNTFLESVLECFDALESDEFVVDGELVECQSITITKYGKERIAVDNRMNRGFIS